MALDVVAEKMNTGQLTIVNYQLSINNEGIKHFSLRFTNSGIEESFEPGFP